VVTDREGERGSGRLPDFVIVGAARAGTTALWTYLREHPGAFLPFRKELNFFNEREPSTDAVARYRQLFEGATDRQRVGEASPLYLYSEDAAGRMAEVIPQAALVVSLREPVARAYSHYWWRRLWRAEERSFEQAVDDELRGAAPPGAEYLAFSRYVGQLKRFARHFPREAIFVTLLSDLKADADGVFDRLCHHVGIDPDLRPAVVGAKVNTSVDVRSVRLWRATQRWQLRYDRRVRPLELVKRMNARRFVPPPIDEGVQARLRRHFEEPNAELAAWLERDLSIWGPRSD